MWDGNPVKLDCDDHCTAIHVINSMSDLTEKRKRNHKKGGKNLICILDTLEWEVRAKE